MAIRKVMQEHKLNHQSVLVAMIVLVTKQQKYDSSFFVHGCFEGFTLR